MLNFRSVSKVLLLIAILGTGIMLGTLYSSNANSVTPVPGSAEDPVVTRSYVANMLREAGLSGGGSGGTGSSGNTGGGSSASLDVVTIPNGQTIVATEEGTEFIVRTGRAVAFSLDRDGIADLTAGADLTNGQRITNNHLLLSPRAGRGVMPDPAVAGSRLIVLARGGYEIR